MLGLSSRLLSSVSIHLGFWFYLVVGSVVFYFIENPLQPESSKKGEAKYEIMVNETFCQVLTQRLNETIMHSDVHYLDMQKVSFKWLEQLTNECSTYLTAVKNNNSIPSESEVTWEFSAALFFSMTLVTTIGYGSFSPVSDGGKLFCIFYGFFGIPLCGLLLANTSEYFSSVLLRFYESQNKNKDHENRLSILTAAALFLLPGLGLFLFIPAVIFAAIEGWTYLDSLYYTFVSLTTIGFRDDVPTLHCDRQWLWFYRVSWIIWVYLGIAYWAIIINFITKAFKSKKLRNRWKQTVRLVSHLSPASNNKPFLASKSKTAFDFALQITGSVGKLESELKNNIGSVLPGIATALKPTSGKGIVALIQLSTGMLGNCVEHANEHEAESSERSSSVARSKNAHVHNIHRDSGIVVEWDGNAEFKAENNSLKQENNCSNDMRRRSSTLSLPMTLEKRSRHSSNQQWEQLEVKSLPQSRKVSVAENKKAIMQDLLLDAIMILNEAQIEEP